MELPIWYRFLSNPFSCHVLKFKLHWYKIVIKVTKNVCGAGFFGTSCKTIHINIHTEYTPPTQGIRTTHTHTHTHTEYTPHTPNTHHIYRIHTTHTEYTPHAHNTHHTHRIHTTYTEYTPHTQNTHHIHRIHTTHRIDTPGIVLKFFNGNHF